MDDIDIRLISLVEKYPTLYDKCRKDFKDTAKKQNVWQTINDILGIEGKVMTDMWLMKISPKIK